MPEFVVTTHLDAGVEESFDLSLSIDAHTSSMAHSGERAVAGVTSGFIGPGEEVTWRARHFGIPFTMTSRITAYERPHRFVDEQVRGPFGAWWHAHRFEEDHDGGCTMTDTIRFRSPLGVLGRLVDRWVLSAYMARLIDERNRWLAAELTRG